MNLTWIPTKGRDNAMRTWFTTQNEARKPKTMTRQNVWKECYRSGERLSMASGMKHTIRRLISVGVLLHATLSWAGIEAIYGDWDGGGGATSAIFGTMTITKSHLSWKGEARGEPRCTVRYERIQEGFGVRFKNQVGDEQVSAPDSPFQTFLLKIDDRKRCALGITHFRMTLREDLPSSVLEDIHYRGLDNPMGRGHFFRPQD